MHHDLLSFGFATLFDFNLPPYMIAIFVPVAGMILGGSLAITAMYFHHQRRRLRHETARVALEKGQPLPEFGDEKDSRRPKSRDDSSRNDLRGGLVLIGIGAGLYLFLDTVGASEARFIGAIPGFIGVALLLHALLTALLPKKTTPPENRPPHS